MSFYHKIIAHYALASLPTENDPPAGIAGWIKTCEDAGLKSAAQAIKDGWKRVFLKYPAVKKNWAAATKIGELSIKKRVFDRKEFQAWFAEQKRA